LTLKTNNVKLTEQSDTLINQRGRQNMIRHLTPEQEEQFAVYRDKWLEIGLSTSPIDVEKSLEQLKKVYEQAGLTFPNKYEVYESPFAAIKAMKEKYGMEVIANHFIYGSHDSFWLALYDYYLNVLDIKICEQLSPFMELARYCGWVLLYDDLVVLTNKPLHIKMDAEHRTHCENDYAIKFRDNTGVTIWHGVRIPSEWIFNKESITEEVLFEWDNVEQRRAACEIIGWNNVISKLHGEVIDKDPETTVGTLYEVDLPGSGKERFLVAYDLNVGKMVGLPVPREMKTALEANAWTYGIDTKDITAEVYRAAAANRA